MKRMLTIIAGFILFVSALAYCADNESVSIQLSTNRMLNVSGFMENTMVVQADAELSAKLSEVKDRMKVLRKPQEKSTPEDKGPQTIDEAAEYLSKYINMAFPPTLCTEYDGVFYFAGGTSTEAVDDFSTGYAIKKGQKEILTW